MKRQILAIFGNNIVKKKKVTGFEANNLINSNIKT